MLLHLALALSSLTPVQQLVVDDGRALVVHERVVGGCHRDLREACGDREANAHSIRALQDGRRTLWENPDYAHLLATHDDGFLVVNIQGTRAALLEPKGGEARFHCEAPTPNPARVVDARFEGDRALLSLKAKIRGGARRPPPGYMELTLTEGGCALRHVEAAPEVHARFQAAEPRAAYGEARTTVVRGETRIGLRVEVGGKVRRVRLQTLPRCKPMRCKPRP